MRLEDIDFAIIGATKSATTWLSQQLRSDPAVYMPGPELHFFSREFHRGTPWYLSQFSPHAGATLIGEKSNSYLDTQEAAERLHSALPNARLIVMLRNPVDRAYSDFCMCYRRGEVRGSIKDCLDPRRAAQDRFLHGSRYDIHLRRILSHYPPEALHVTQYEQVGPDPQGLMDGVRAHLGLSSLPVTASAREKVKDRNAHMVPLRLRRRLASLKPLVAPLRGTRPFEAARSLFTAKVQYPELSSDLRQRMADYFAPMEDALASMGYTVASSAPLPLRDRAAVPRAVQEA